MERFYFGIALNDDNKLQIDYNDIIARLFICTNLNANYVQNFISKLITGKASKSEISRIMDLTNAQIKEWARKTGLPSEIVDAMNKKRIEWSNNVFSAPCLEDYEYLESKYHISSDMIFGRPTKEIAKPFFHNAKEMADIVKKHIVGQDKAIERLAVSFFQQLDCLRHKRNCSIKSSVMLIGPTGSGKSQIMEEFRRIYNGPVIRINTNDIVPSAWSGLHLSDILKDEVLRYGKALKYAVIIFHEIDKISHPESTAGRNFDLDMQREIMRLFESGYCIDLRIPAQDGNTTINCKLPVDNMLVLFEGAFSGIENIIRKRLKLANGKRIGYSCDNAGNIAPRLDSITVEDLEEWGFKNELISRIGEICTINPIDENTIYRILTETPDNILTAHVDYCKSLGINLTFDDKALKAIAHTAAASGLGFRNVKTLLSKCMQEIYYRYGQPEKELNITIDEVFTKQSLYNNN